MIRQYVLLYKPSVVQPEIITIKNNNLYQEISKLCEGFETISTAKLLGIVPNTIMICADDFQYLKDKRVNIVGTYLYNCDWEIKGNVCIAKQIMMNNEVTLGGLSISEIEMFISTLHNMMKEIKL